MGLLWKSVVDVPTTQENNISTLRNYPTLRHIENADVPRRVPAVQDHVVVSVTHTIPVGTLESNVENLTRILASLGRSGTQGGLNIRRPYSIELELEEDLDDWIIAHEIQDQAIILGTHNGFTRMGVVERERNQDRVNLPRNTIEASDADREDSETDDDYLTN
jgi:hypothetical protein